MQDFASLIIRDGEMSRLCQNDYATLRISSGVIQSIPSELAGNVSYPPVIAIWGDDGDS